LTAALPLGLALAPTAALAFDRPFLAAPYGVLMIAARPAYRGYEAPLHPRDIVDILIEDYGFQAVRRPRFAGPVYLAEGIDRRGNRVHVVVDSGNGRVIERDVIERALGDRRGGEARLAHAEPFANRAAPDRRAPDMAPAPPRRPPELTGQRPAPTPPVRPPSAAAQPAPGLLMTPVPPRPRFADPRPLGEPDQPPPFARGARPGELAPGASAPPETAP
jgi:hypothetical protein